MVGHQKEVGRCTACGAALVGGQAQCWLCHRNTGEAADENPYASPRPVAGEYEAAQFSLASLFLVMTLMAVCVGLFAIAPGLAVLVGFVATPALIRTIVAAGYQRQAGTPLSAGEKVGVFFVSWFIMGAIGMAIFVAFATVCVAGALLTEVWISDLGTMFVVGALGGLVVALPLAFWLLRVSAPARPAFNKLPDRE